MNPALLGYLGWLWNEDPFSTTLFHDNFRVADDALRTPFFAILVLAKNPCRVDPQDSRSRNSTCNGCDCKQEAGPLPRR